MAKRVAGNYLIKDGMEDDTAMNEDAPQRADEATMNKRTIKPLRKSRIGSSAPVGSSGASSFSSSNSGFSFGSNPSAGSTSTTGNIFNFGAPAASSFPPTNGTPSISGNNNSSQSFGGFSSGGFGGFGSNNTSTGSAMNSAPVFNFGGGSTTGGGNVSTPSTSANIFQFGAPTTNAPSNPFASTNTSTSQPASQSSPFNFGGGTTTAAPSQPFQNPFSSISTSTAPSISSAAPIFNFGAQNTSKPSSPSPSPVPAANSLFSKPAEQAQSTLKPVESSSFNSTTPAVEQEKPTSPNPFAALNIPKEKATPQAQPSTNANSLFTTKPSALTGINSQDDKKQSTNSITTTSSSTPNIFSFASSTSKSSTPATTPSTNIFSASKPSSSVATPSSTQPSTSASPLFSASSMSQTPSSVAPFGGNKSTTPASTTTTIPKMQNPYTPTGIKSPFMTKEILDNFAGPVDSSLTSQEVEKLRYAKVSHLNKAVRDIFKDWDVTLAHTNTDSVSMHEFRDMRAIFANYIQTFEAIMGGPSETSKNVSQTNNSFKPTASSINPSTSSFGSSTNQTNQPGGFKFPGVSTGANTTPSTPSSSSASKFQSMLNEPIQEPKAPSTPTQNKEFAGTTPFKQPSVSSTPTFGFVPSAAVNGTSNFASQFAKNASPSTSGPVKSSGFTPSVGFKPAGGFVPTSAVAAGANFAAQFGKAAEATKAEIERKRRLEEESDSDSDSDSDSEPETNGTTKTTAPEPERKRKLENDEGDDQDVERKNKIARFGEELNVPPTNLFSKGSSFVFDKQANLSAQSSRSGSPASVLNEKMPDSSSNPFAHLSSDNENSTGKDRADESEEEEEITGSSIFSRITPKSPTGPKSTSSLKAVESEKPKSTPIGPSTNAFGSSGFAKFSAGNSFGGSLAKTNGTTSGFSSPFSNGTTFGTPTPQKGLSAAPQLKLNDAEVKSSDDEIPTDSEAGDFYDPNKTPKQSDFIESFKKGQPDSDIIWSNDKGKALKFKNGKWETAGVGPVLLLRNKSDKVTSLLMKVVPSGKTLIHTRIHERGGYEVIGRRLKFMHAYKNKDGEYTVENWLLQFSEEGAAAELSKQCLANGGS